MGMAPEWRAATLNHGSIPPHEKSHLVLGGCGVLELAEIYGTPLHVVDTTRLRDSYRRFLAAFRAHHPRVELFCSYKTNCIPGVLKVLHDKERLGHSSIQVTADLYGRLVPGANRSALDRLAAATSCNLAATEEENRGEESGGSRKLEPGAGVEPATY